MEKPDDFNVNDLIEHLQGTCQSLDEGVGSLYENCDSSILTDDDRSEINNAIFLCNDCGWWFELSDQSEDGDGNCKDCAGE